MVHDNGTWHLYYQHNPYGREWGNIEWGHATSTDLLHWNRHAPAIRSRTPGGSKGQSYSGSVVVDKDNTAGFGAGALVAVYTDTEGGNAQHRRAEVLAHSLNGGMSYAYFKGNPVLPHDGRDPRAFWHEETGRWVIVVYDEKNKDRKFQIYTSDNLREWKYQSEVLGYDLYECPEFFPLPVDGDAAKKAWVMVDAACSYLVGEFDGGRFIPWAGKKLKGQTRSTAYAMQTFNNAPGGRRIGMAWLRQFYPSGMPFNGAMSVPLELSLRTTPAGLRLHSYPVAELEALRRSPVHFDKQTAAKGERILMERTGGELDIEASFHLAPGDEAGLDIHGVRLVYNAVSGLFRCGDVEVEMPLVEGKMDLRVLVDRGIMEVFVNRGLIYAPLITWKMAPQRSHVTLLGGGRGSRLNHMTVYQMNSIWK
jgi:fructan beta-fructosidase